MKLTVDNFDLLTVLEKHGLKECDLIQVLGVTDRTVFFWRSGERRPSAERAMQAEKLLKIPRHELRPDLWPPPKRGPKQHRFKASGDFQLRTRELAAVD
jgi:DNA-binding transcriptional regulator YdaS (Cro superfamily)